MTFFFRRLASAIDPRRLVHSDATFQGLRRRMIEDLGFDPAHADRILDDMLSRALTRFGDEFVTGRSLLLDRVVDLRQRLDGLYHQILNFDAAGGTRTTRIDPTGRGSINDQLRAIERLYREIDEAFEQLGQPLDDLVPTTTGRRNVAEETAAEIAQILDTAGPQTRPSGHGHRDVTLDVSEGRLTDYGFEVVAGSNDTQFRRIFSDGSTATFTIEHGRYVVTTRDASGLETTFREFDLLSTPYGRRPLTTGLIQAHHGCQNSLMNRLFGSFGYNGDAAPTSWMRNHATGSPHGVISARQRSNSSARSGMTRLSDIRRVAIEDLGLAGMPNDMITAYIRAFDEYFEAAVLPQLRAKGRLDLLGDWLPPSGAAL